MQNLKKLKNIKHIHFVGLKGIGMTALACIADDYGLKLTGSDSAEIFQTDKIIKKRAFTLASSFSAGNIKNADIVVFSAGHGGINNPEILAAKKKGIPVISQAEFLALFMQGKRVISVAGVGGKSSVSAMLATVLTSAGLDPSYFVGVAGIDPLGDPAAYRKNSKIFISEADEYFDPKSNCPKFFHQRPDYIIIPNLAYDHPDVYKDTGDTLNCFARFINSARENVLLTANTDQPLVNQLLKKTKKSCQTYGFGKKADGRIIDYKNKQPGSIITLKLNKKKYTFSLQVSGEYNALNATAVVMQSFVLGLSFQQIKIGLQDFGGTKRRFEKIWQHKELSLYDDYAHHPEEIRALLKHARHFFSGKKLIVIFQPHTYTRTRQLAKEFAGSFGDCDYCLLMDIFSSAREKFDPAITSQKLVDLINQNKQNAYYCPEKEDILNFLRKKLDPATVVMTVGAGNLFHWHNDIIKALKEKYL